MKTELKFGAAFAGALIVYVLIEHLLGFNTTRHDIGQYSRMLEWLFPILGTYYGIRQKRTDQFGVLTYGQGVRTGLLVSLILAALAALWALLYLAAINPEFLDTLIRFERSSMAAAGAIEPEIAPTIERLRWIYSLPVMPIVYLIAATAVGTLSALVFSWFLQKKAELV